MEEYNAELLKSPLFKGISPTEVDTFLQCRGSRKQVYQKGEMMFQKGSRLTEIGIILKGRVRSYRDMELDTMLFDLHVGQCFGSTFILNGISEIPVTFVAAEDSQILYMDIVKLIRCCPKACSKHGRIIENLINLTMEKNKLVQLKKEILKQIDCRSKVLLYLMFMKQKYQNDSFVITTSREDWALFLNMRKNDLINVLIGLKKEGIIEYNRSQFKILNEAALPKEFLEKLEIPDIY